MTMESYISATKHLLESILKQHIKLRRWHYAITLDHNNPNSFAHLINFTLDELKLLLINLGLASALKNGQFILNPPKWRNMLIEQGLDRDCYFDFMEVRHVMNEHGTTVNYRGYWIGVGDDTIFKNNHRKHPTPSTQFKLFNNPSQMQGKYNITK